MLIAANDVMVRQAHHEVRSGRAGSEALTLSLSKGERGGRGVLTDDPSLMSRPPSLDATYPTNASSSATTAGMAANAMTVCAAVIPAIKGASPPSCRERI